MKYEFSLYNIKKSRIRKETCLAKINFVFIGIVVFIVLVLYSITTSAVYAQQDRELISASLDSPFSLHINETAVINSENIAIKFLDVIEDSRCPSDVACIWAGQVRISINIIKDMTDIGNFDLTLGPLEEYPSTATFTAAQDSYKIELLSVDPYPDHKIESKNSEYESSLVVSKVK